VSAFAGSVLDSPQLSEPIPVPTRGPRMLFPETLITSSGLSLSCADITDAVDQPVCGVAGPSVVSQYVAQNPAHKHPSR
jgi:hypothetical protein